MSSNNNKTNFPVSFSRWWVRLTRVCNNRCKFCLDSEAQDGTYIEYDKILSEYKKGIAQGAKRVILSGGEPTIHPQIINLISAAKKTGYDEIQIITNGRMFYYQDFLNQAVESGLSEATFSIHGHNSTLHDSLVGVNGAFKQSIKGIINALNSKKLIVNVDIVVNKENVNYLKNILEYCYNLGVREFDILQVQPSGRARQDMLYDIEDKKQYWHKALKWGEEKKIVLWTNRLQAEYLEGFEYLIQSPEKLYDEIKGRYKEIYDWLNSGKTLQCFNKLCNFCFLKDFCNFIYKFLNNYPIRLIIENKSNAQDFLLVKSAQRIRAYGKQATDKFNLETDIKSLKYTGFKISRLIIDDLNDINKLPENIKEIEINLQNLNSSSEKILKKLSKKVDIYLSLPQYSKQIGSYINKFQSIIKSSDLSFFSENIPLCWHVKSKDNFINITDDCYSKETGFEPMNLTKCFIKYHYSVYGQSCRNCSLREKCKGLHIDYIKNQGFSLIHNT